MFSPKELNIDTDYFEIIGYSSFCVTLKSRNTGHYWHIQNVDGKNYRSCKVYHRHKSSGEYHLHGHVGTLRKCISDIKSHDQFQLNGRKKETKKRETHAKLFSANLPDSYKLLSCFFCFSG